jgi:S-adenosylmethionine decarboxylase
MAFDDTLFQLGMDLTRSSTAQKEDPNTSVRVVRDEVQPDHFIERDGVRYAGDHLLVDIVGGRRLDDLKHIERTLRRCVEVANATLLHVHLHRISPDGSVSGVAVLAGGHISFHSRPAAGFAVLDVLMSGQAAPERCLDVLRVAFDAREAVVRPVRRGEVAEPQAAEARAAGRATGRPARQVRVRRAA